MPQDFPGPRPPETSAPPQEGLVLGPTGELVDERVTLFSNPEQSETWTSWADQDPNVLALWRELKIVDVLDSQKWLNLVEHNMYVAGVALSIGLELQKAGLEVDLNTLIRAGMIHDAGTHYNVEIKKTREAEAMDNDTTVLDAMKRNGFNDNTINVSMNSGRLPDRYLPTGQRMDAIRGRSLEENILGLADARTINATVVSLDEAQANYLHVKPDEKSQAFFTDNWLPYYKDVESYLQLLAPGFDSQAITDDLVFANVQAQVSSKR